ncbi:MAG: hypothetical protein HY814_04570, partial [Candidatus Riflebacteria bacterium]|nr:hypothetical protein [Candidatus Riflebacteria bacterium]
MHGSSAGASRRPTARGPRPAALGRRGVVLVLALVITMVLAIAIMAFHSSTLQSKREVSRSHLGDVALYLAESAAEEAMTGIRAEVNRPGSPWYLRFQEGTVATNENFVAIEDLPETLASPVGRDFDAEVSAKARVLVLAVSSGTDPREKVGSVEVEGQARV